MQWLRIASELQTGRSPAECLGWYQKHAENGHKAWSQQEIRQLRVSYAMHAGKAAFWKVSEWQHCLVHRNGLLLQYHNLEHLNCHVLYQSGWGCLDGYIKIRSAT